MPEWIAERRLSLHRADEDIELVIRLSKPTQEPTGDFACDYCIEGLAEKFEYSILGVDQIQALQLATFMLGSHLNNLEGVCSWLGERGYTGLPKSLGDPVCGIGLKNERGEEL